MSDCVTVWVEVRYLIRTGHLLWQLSEEADARISRHFGGRRLEITSVGEIVTLFKGKVSIVTLCKPLTLKFAKWGY